jgi:murein DD-endopeptidase MepM/ murein hydrolase activator NlpD
MGTWTRCALAALLGLIAAPATALELNGEPRQGALLTGRAEPGSRVVFAGRPVRLGPRGHFVVGLGREAPPTVELTWRAPDGPRHRRTVAVGQRSFGVQRIDGLPSHLVHPGQAALDRIRREQARVRQARRGFTPLSGYRQGFAWPLEGPVTGVYGTRRVLNGEPRQPHFGIDIAAAAGTPVRAPAAGIVRLAAPDLYFSGGTLILDHGHGVTSSLLHLSAFRVRTGERVRKGEIIAEVGATGRVTGAHLDWRVNWFDRRLDPALLAGPMPQAGGGTARGG